MDNTPFNVHRYGNILIENMQLGPFPMHRLKRLEKPTTLVTNNINRVDARETAFQRAARGDYGPTVQREQNRTKKEPLIAAQLDIVRHLASIKENEVAAVQAPIPEDPNILSRHIKSLGYYLRASIVGICRFPESSVYSLDVQGNPIAIDYPYAVVIVVSKEYKTVKASDGHDWIVDSISFQAYQLAALIAQTMANYIRRLGFRASPQHNGKYQILIPQLLLWSGIGEVSRTGIILNPFLGLNFKTAAVLTDLPLAPDKPIDFGLQDYCQNCHICAELCPSKAISMGDKSMYNGYETWKLNEQRCASFFVSNSKGAGCGKCVKVCPFTKPNLSTRNLNRLDFNDNNLARKLATSVNNPANRAKDNKRGKWWFDLEDMDGTLRIPETL
ncbi:reductive dehalogenase [Chloroflexota bacterium]